MSYPGYHKTDDDDSGRVSSFFPSISLVNSMPVRPEDVVRIASTATSWEAVAQGGRALDARVKSAKKPHSRALHTIGEEGGDKHRTITNKLILALVADKAAGGPFRMFLERLEH